MGIHAAVRVTLTFVWIWHGLIPKIIFRDIGEQTMLMQAGVGIRWLPWIGAGEVVFGLVVLFAWHMRSVLLVNGVVMVLATFAVAMRSPQFVGAAFNPVTLNLAVAALAVVGWMASRELPTAQRCLRKDPRVSV